MPTKLSNPINTVSRGATTFAIVALGFVTGCATAPDSHSQQALAPSAQPSLAVAKQAMPIYDATSLQQACQAALKQARVAADALAKQEFSISEGNDFFEAWDRSGMVTESVLGPAYLQAYVHPDAEVREAGQQCILDVTEFQTELFQNVELYQQLLNAVPAPPQLGPTLQLRQDLIHAFTSSGVTLPPKQRLVARDITQRIQELAQEFQSNLRDNNNQLYFSEAEVEGLPADWKQEAKQDDGRYAVGYDYPQYFPFMRNAKSEAARKRYYQAFTNRGGERNLAVLDEIVALRAKLAKLHGVENFATLATQNRMAGSPTAVENFLAEVGERVAPLEQRDIADLTQLKATQTQQANSKLQQWDLQFYLEQARQQRFAIDQEALRAYFPTAATVEWALAINQKLLGIRIERATAPLWHESVEYYDVYDAADNRYLGAMYLDLYPRDGKYKHAAAFSVRSGSRLLDRRPTSVLVTNFNAEGLSQNEVETLLHELGHVFHGVLSNTWYGSHSGTEVKRDFVEAPSQMLEAWAQRYETLSQVAHYCGDCPAISQQMVQRLEAARQFGQGSFYARQHLYASFDMALATGQSEGSAQELWAKMEGATLLGHLEGTEFPATFGHIVGGYAAGYYGYMWSEVLAKDMQSVFGNNLMNTTLGLRYRQHILEKGGEQPPQKLVRGFLGREPSTEAFFKQFEH